MGRRYLFRQHVLPVLVAFDHYSLYQTVFDGIKPSGGRALCQELKMRSWRIRTVSPMSAFCAKNPLANNAFLS
jgi:hypothetical protein